jgi:hypothetical protein
MPADVALINKWRRVQGAYPFQLGESLPGRIYPVVVMVAVTIGCCTMEFKACQKFLDNEGRVGHTGETTPVLVMGDGNSTNEPPIRVPMAVPSCNLCGNSLDVAVQKPGSEQNALKGRNDESGSRYVWNGPFTNEDSPDDPTEVGVGSIYGYRWRHARLRPGTHVYNASLMFEVVTEKPSREDSGIEDRYFGDPLMLTFFGEVTADSQEFCSLSTCQARDLPLRRRARHRTVAEVKWEVPPNPELWSTAEQSACPTEWPAAVCLQTADLSPILNELASLPDWQAQSPVVIFATVEGTGMRPVVMLHDNRLWQLTEAVFVFLAPAIFFGYLAIGQVCRHRNHDP